MVKNDDDLTSVLEEASADRLMDDNDNIVVDIHCTFVNTYKGGEVFRENATAAAENARKAVKTWLDKASNLFQKFAADEDYVVVRKREVRENVAPAEWVSRFVQFLFNEVRVPPKKRSKPSARPPTVHKKTVSKPKESPLDTAEDILDIAVVGFTMATELLNESIMRQEEVFRGFFSKIGDKRRSNARQTSLSSSISSTSSKASLPSVTSPVNSPDDEMDFNLDRGVEIEFDPENENNELTEDEWKIFFTTSSSEEGGAVLLDIPSEQDVVSISSDEFAECEQNTSVSDDGSWAVLDDE